MTTKISKLEPIDSPETNYEEVQADDPDETIESAQSQPVQAVHVIDPQLGQPVGQPMQHATVVTTSGHHFQHQEILKGEEIHIPINGDNIAINELAKKGYQIRIASNGKKSARWRYRITRWRYIYT